MLGVPRDAVSRHRWARGIPCYADPSTHHDWVSVSQEMTAVDIANMLGVTATAVRLHYKRMGLKPKYQIVAAGIDFDGISGLGKMWDGWLALELGVHESTVRNARVARGIPAHTERRVCLCGTEFVVSGYTMRKMFCSPVCSHASSTWLDGGGDRDLLPAVCKLAKFRRSINDKTGKRPRKARYEARTMRGMEVAQDETVLGPGRE